MSPLKSIQSRNPKAISVSRLEENKKLIPSPHFHPFETHNSSTEACILLKPRPERSRSVDFPVTMS